MMIKRTYQTIHGAASSPPHPIAAPYMLQRVAEVQLSGPRHARPRHSAQFDILNMLAKDVPITLDGWAVWTYFLLAGSHGPRDRESWSDAPECRAIAHAARQVTLLECFGASEAVTSAQGDALPEGVRVVDLPGAAALSCVFIAHVRAMEDSPRREVMLEYLLAEHHALWGMLDPADKDIVRSMLGNGARSSLC